MVEPGYSGARNAKTRGVADVICSTTHSVGFKNESLPAIGVFDVVEHIQEDCEFLNHLQKLLRPGGMLYLTVPAYSFLWSEEDVEAGHFRRYNLQQIEQKIVSAGLQPVFGTYIFEILPFAIFLYRTLAYWIRIVAPLKIRKISLEYQHSRKTFASRLLEKTLGKEVRQIRRQRRRSFGSSCLVAAKRV